MSIKHDLCNSQISPIIEIAYVGLLYLFHLAGAWDFAKVLNYNGKQ